MHLQTSPGRINKLLAFDPHVLVGFRHLSSAILARAFQRIADLIGALRNDSVVNRLLKERVRTSAIEPCMKRGINRSIPAFSPNAWQSTLLQIGAKGHGEPTA